MMPADQVWLTPYGKTPRATHLCKIEGITKCSVVGMFSSFLTEELHDSQ